MPRGRKIQKPHHKKGVLTEFETDHNPVKHRSKPFLELKKRFLIYCEGMNTEPSYFRQFKLPTVEILTFGEGYNTLSLVERALAIKSGREYEQVWCVFDADDHGVENFNNAVKLAEENKIGAAYSIQAFEYWLLLHFNDHQGGKMHRNDYHVRINEYLSHFGVTYKGTGDKKISEELFDILMGVDEATQKTRIELAIERAKRVYSRYDHRSPGSEESSTTVFKLVEELKKYL